MPTEDLLCAAIRIMTEASGRAAQLFTVGNSASLKADGTEVTPADIEVETLLRTLIGASYPDDAVIGEEQDAKPGNTGRRWVLDPINGTSLFVRRAPTFNMLLTVEHEGNAVVCVIAYPVTGELYYAGRGLGSWRAYPGGDPQRLNVSDTRKLRGATCSTVNPATWHESLLIALHRELFLLPSLKSSAGVAEGMTDARIVAGHPMGYEDVAPIPLLISEAGGRVTDLDGNDVRSGTGSVLATNGHVHDEILALVRDLPHGADRRFRATTKP